MSTNLILFCPTCGSSVDIEDTNQAQESTEMVLRCANNHRFGHTEWPGGSTDKPAVKLTVKPDANPVPYSPGICSLGLAAKFAVDHAVK